MRTFQVTYLIGNLGRDPEMKYAPSGTAVTNFTVAVNRTRRDPSGENVEEAEWFRVVAWDRLAETCDEHLRKGDRVYVEGRLQSRKYTDKDGVERTAVEVVATDLVMLGGRTDEAAAPAPAQRRPSQSPKEAITTADADPDDFDFDSGDVPF
jgi:single-strand DNA-binding protein